MMGNAKFELEGYMMLAFSKSVDSSVNQACCLRGNVYGFWSKGFMLSVGMKVI